MSRRLPMILPVIAALIAAAPLAACGGDDDNPGTTVTPTSGTDPGATTPGSSTGATMTGNTVEGGGSATTLGDDNAPTEGETGNGATASTGG